MTKKLEGLVSEWDRLHKLENKIKKERLEVERSIISFCDNLPQKGTTKILNSMKITTGVSVSYDQESLMALYRSGEIPAAEFPFEKTFKPVNSELRYLEKNKPHLFKKINECATTKEKKPSFKMEEK